jgi:hypothetical protein
MNDLDPLNTATVAGTGGPSATGARRPHRRRGRNLQNGEAQ